MAKDLSKLVKKVVTDKTGKRTTVWVKQGEDPKTEKKTKKPEVEGKEKKDKGGAKQALREASMKLDELAKMANEAREKGEAAPNFNLCEITIPNTNLFCGDNKGVVRAKMPQLKGEAAPNTDAAKIAKETGELEVDGEEKFKDFLRQSGVKMTTKEVPAQNLKATQSELVGAKVAGMTEALKKDPTHAAITAPIFVSKDGYVLDGHHRWAAHVGLRISKENKNNPVNMSIVEVDMPMEKLLDVTNKWATEFGIAQKEAKTKVSEEVKKALNTLFNEQK